MQNPLVSVLIPMYNSAKWIEETIQSVLDQTYSNLEIIVVDDGSTDSSWEQIEGLRKHFPKKIFIFKNPGKGACAARNYAFQQSKGDFIQWLDADDLLEKVKIETQIKLFQKIPEAELISCNWVRFIGNILNRVGVEGPHDSIQKDLSAFDWLSLKHTMPVHAWLTKRNLVENSPPWDETLEMNQDGAYYYGLIANTKKVYFTNQSIVYYRLLNASVSTPTPVKLFSLLKSAVIYQEALFKLGNGYESKLAAANFFRQIQFIAFGQNKSVYEDSKKKIEALGVKPTIDYNAGGRIGTFIYKLFGWKSLVLIKKFLKP